MRYLLLALFLLVFFQAPAMAGGDGRNHDSKATRQDYRLLSDTLACPLPRELSASATENLDSRVRLALSGRLVQPPSEDAEELAHNERVSIFIGLRCLLD
ncbi:MAG: hypothetical protein Tsb0017_17120 [Geothermobacteraceae bacterium]